MTHEEPVHRADPDRGTALDQPRLNLNEGHVSLLGDQLPDEAAVRFDLARMPVSAARLTPYFPKSHGKPRVEIGAY